MPTKKKNNTTNYQEAPLEADGNERAENLASRTPIAETLTIGRSAILGAIRDNSMRNEISMEETIGLRLLEWGINYGTRNMDRIRGRTCCVTNQWIWSVLLTDMDAYAIWQCT